MTRPSRSPLLPLLAALLCPLAGREALAGSAEVFPRSDAETGFAGWDGGAGYTRLPGEMVSGTLAIIDPAWLNVNAYARFDTSPIPDGATVLDVTLEVWVNNHDNPGDPAVSLPMQVHECAVDPLTATDQELFEAIETGAVLVDTSMVRTGPEFCLSSYQLFTYPLPGAVASLEALLPDDRFAVGFTSEIVTDPGFDHIDYMGFREQVNGGCGSEPAPGTRIRLRVNYNEPPVCNPGGPYLAECEGAETTVAVDGSGSSDPDGDPLTFAWSTDCPGGAFADPALASTTLTLASGDSCDLVCHAMLAVSDGLGTSECTSDVQVSDTTPPEVSGGGSSELCLWPPNHWYVCLDAEDFAGSIADLCGSVSLRFESCASDQPDDAPEDDWNGDGHTTDDCVVVAGGNTVCVRAERAGGKGKAPAQAGRHYAVAMVAVDDCGNASAALAATVTVPHDQDPHAACIKTTERGCRPNQSIPCGR